MFLVKSDPKPEDLVLWRRVGMALGAHEPHGHPFQRRARRGKHHVDARRTQTYDHDASASSTVAHVVGVVVAFLELRTAGTFGASTREVFGFHVP